MTFLNVKILHLRRGLACIDIWFASSQLAARCVHAWSKQHCSAMEAPHWSLVVCPQSKLWWPSLFAVPIHAFTAVKTVDSAPLGW